MLLEQILPDLEETLPELQVTGLMLLEVHEPILQDIPIG